MINRGRSSSHTSKATQYRGNGKFYSQYRGSMLARPLTEDERCVEAHLREKYGHQLADFCMMAGTNMQKPIWMLVFDDGREVETSVGPHELGAEIVNILRRNS